MRIVLLSDVHANQPAFERAIEEVRHLAPDLVILGGDVINRGPCPAACLDHALACIKEGWRPICGNHEEYVLQEAEPVAGNRPQWMAKLCAHSRWTAGRLTVRHLEAIRTWPAEQRIEAPDGSRLCFMHASRAGNRAGLYRQANHEQLDGLIDPQADVFGVGHTHVPFIRQHGRTLIVNAGSVGMPFDGDHRISLAVIEKSRAEWTARTVRIPYDRARTDRDFHDTGYLASGGPMTPLIYHEFQQARPRLGEWHRLFESLVRSEQMTIEDSVAAMLNAP